MTDIDTTRAVLAAGAVILGSGAAIGRGRLALAMLAAALFTVLAFLAVEINSGWMTSLDDSAWNWFYRHRFHRLRVDSQGLFSYIGQPVPFTTAGVLSGTLLALQARSAMRAVVVIGGVGVGVAAEETLKAVVSRTPSTLATLHDGSLLEYTHSFPSGHVTACGTLLGMIAVCLGIGRSRVAQAALAVPAVTGVLFVAVLALHSRAHIFTDVLGGMVLAAAIVAAGASALGPPKPGRVRA
ncbi:phosphatase PAP2 family protein [Mycobacterium sp. NBC_00419]|uniref:phosphatase PAP2 family protein n=1 Tax=Mycobacterium sp. NBC_00419 TaxID=2975989 RepID=UPI002E1E017E